MASRFGTRKITANQMVELERTFHEESKDAGGLDMDQFVRVFENVLAAIDDDHHEDPPQDNPDGANPRQSVSLDPEEERANSKRYLTHLFMKIDANSDGTVDWEEFLNFLLLENQGLESSNFDQQRDTLIREKMDCDNYHRNHSNMISSILHFPNLSRYVTGSLDGTIKLWDTASFEIKKTIINSPNHSWVMDLVHLPLSSQIAAVSMDGIVNIYSPSSWKLHSQIMNKGYILGENYGDSKKFNREEQRWLITSSPVCADGSVLNEVHELLAVGTEAGRAFLFVLNNNSAANESAASSMVGDSSSGPNDLDFHICSGDQSLAPNQVSIKNKLYKWNKRGAMSHDQGGNELNESTVSPVLSCSHIQPFRVGVEPLVMDIHNDWITNISYNEDLQSLVTCSLDSQLRFSDIERRKKTRIYMGHSRGVHHFAYNPEFKFMASCGVERKIHIFDPHRCAKLQLLVGHSTSVTNVLMKAARHQIISLSADKVIKIWDTRTFRCLQTLHDSVGYQPDNRISALLFDDDNKRLITCSSKLQSWPIRMETRKRRIKSHDCAVSAAYFNKHFQQCVSADFSGNVLVWDIETSSRVFTYSVGGGQRTQSALHHHHRGDAADAAADRKSDALSHCETVTSLTFDSSQRRVITGTDSGTLKMWNFSSGQCLCSFRDHHCKFAHWTIDDEEEGDDDGDGDGDGDGDAQRHSGSVAANNEAAKRRRRQLDGHGAGGQSPPNPLQHGTEITGIVYVMEVTSWSAKEVEHWFESFRDVSVRSVGAVLVGHGVTGSQLLELSHDALRQKYGVEDVVARRKLLASIASLYQSNVASRYIVSVGWDNRLRVWIDSTSTNKKALQHPVSVMPSETNLKASNQTEILCITHYPPNSVVTGGADGSIAIWNVVSGHFQRRAPYPKCATLNDFEDTSCAQVRWLNEFKLVISGHSNGAIVFWNPNHSTTTTSKLKSIAGPNRRSKRSLSAASGSGIVAGWRQTAHRRFGGITAMVVAKKSTVLVTCDHGAMLQIFDLTAIGLLDLDSTQRVDLKETVRRRNIWCTGHDNITSVDYLEGRDLILTAGHDGEIVLWTHCGRKIGMFGQMTYFKNSAQDPVPKLWNLNDPKSFVDQQSRSELDSISDDPQIAKKKGLSRKESRRALGAGTGDSGALGDGERNKENEVKISEDTLRLLQLNNTADLDSNEATDTLLSSPELHAILQKPAHHGRPRKRNQLRKLVTRQLKTFELDEIPKESPFK